MEVFHRVTFNKINGADERLDIIGIKYKRSYLPGGSYIVTFEIKESDPNWLVIKELIKEKDGADFVGRVFTNKEIIMAKFSRLLVTKEAGYPYSENHWPSNKKVFYENYCEGCGVYKRQQGYFRVKQDFSPNYDFVSLMWSSGAVFCSQNIIYAIKSNNFSGFTLKEVFLKSTEEVSRYKQLIIPLAIKGEMKNEGARFDVCVKCGTKKFDYIKNDFIKYNYSSLNTMDFQVTNEWFGSGLVAFRQIIVSQRVAKIITENKWRGVKLEPLQLE